MAATASPPGHWYLRSMADHDTHRGAYSTATRSVHSACGEEFIPLPVGLRGDRVALPGQPPDPDQVCPDCQAGRRTPASPR